VILLIDNYDSFTYNLYQALSVLGPEVRVFRNDEIDVSDISRLSPEGIVISPGPGNPDEAGISCDVVRYIAGSIPLLGVCLGHQCVGAAYGGYIVSAPQLLHGKTSDVYHDGSGVFAGLPSPFLAVRYHSLVIDRSSLPEVFQITATTSDGTIMGIKHKETGSEGVQFHPESVLTDQGPNLLQNFVQRCRELVA